MKTMFEKPIHLTLLIHSLVIGAVIIFMAVNNTDQPKLAYINTTEVFEEFALTQELEARLNQVKNKRQAILDSLRLDLQVLSNHLQKSGEPDHQALSVFNKKKENYLRQEQDFSQSNQELTGQYNEQIAQQINQYVKEFGEKQGYQFIYGADGTGALMYAGEGENITQETISFINKRYQGLASK